MVIYRTTLIISLHYEHCYKREYFLGLPHTQRTGAHLRQMVSARYLHAEPGTDHALQRDKKADTRHFAEGIDKHTTNAGDRWLHNATGVRRSATKGRILTDTTHLHPPTHSQQPHSMGARQHGCDNK